MIKPKFTFFQMEIESALLHSPEVNQASLGMQGITPAKGMAFSRRDNCFINSV